MEKASCLHQNVNSVQVKDQELNAGSHWKAQTTTHGSGRQADPRGSSARTRGPRDLAVGMQMCTSCLSIQTQPGDSSQQGPERAHFSLKSLGMQHF